MGVEMIGFCFDSTNVNYIDVATALGILGWLSGVKIVAEFGENTVEEIEIICKDLQPDFISLSAMASLSAGIEIPIICRFDLAQKLITFPPLAAFVLVQNASLTAGGSDAHAFVKELGESYHLFLCDGFTKDNIHEVQRVYQPYGYSLKGGKELAPGLKNFDDLAEILEALETN